LRIYAKEGFMLNAVWRLLGLIGAGVAYALAAVAYAFV
jgi:hypothetical protein